MGPMNSARVHCLRENSQKLWLENKKKRKKRKKGKHANRKTQMRNVNPNPILNLSIKEGKKRQGRRGTNVGICAIFYTLIIEGERI